ncbi:MAG: hypothetical protein IOD15_01125 [Phycisphaerales bacterium]|nr:hypothetical protein [Phycisphaerales bacterium]
MAARDDLIVELDARGLAGAEVVDDMIAAITAAGYDVVPTGGGPAVEVVGTVTSARRRVVGARGLYVVAVNLPSGGVIEVLERHVAGKLPEIVAAAGTVAGTGPVTP